MHLAVVTDTYAPDVNGVARTLRNLSEGMVARGHRVEVIRAGAARGALETGVPGLCWPWYKEVRIGLPKYRWFLDRWRREKPDVIYVSVETALGYSATAAAMALGIPVVGGFHTNFREYFHNYGYGWLGDFLFRYQRWYHGRIAMTLAPSPDSREKLREEGFPHVEILGRGVDAALFSPAKRDASLRQSWGATAETLVVLIGGRISSEKNLAVALRAYERLRDRSRDVKCVMVGDGPLRARLQKRYPEVIFTGYLAGEELARHYASADALVFASMTETFGNVVLEAMACGLAVLAFDDAAAAWHGKNGENILKVPLGDEAAFLSAAETLGDRQLRGVLGAGALKTARELTWPEIVGDWERLLRRAIVRTTLPAVSFTKEK